jgi:hypothetical protein
LLDDRLRREITVDADPAARDVTERVLAAAAEVLRQHRPDGDGWCSGCLAVWGRLVFFERCMQVAWAAAAVRAAYMQGRRDDRPAPPTD